MAKRARELAVKEKRERKKARRAEAAAQRVAGVEGEALAEDGADGALDDEMRADEASEVAAEHDA
jgi:hypothetical protein